MRVIALASLLGLVAAAISCGGANIPPQQGALTGNWQIALARQASSGSPLMYTGFLVQTGNSISGTVIFNLTVGSGLCQGTGSITGHVDGQNLTLSINEFGQQVSLTGTMPSDGGPIGGQFSNLAGGCTNFPNNGTWTATQVAPIGGNFQGTFTSTAIPSNGSFTVSGSLNEGANTGESTATLYGAISADNSASFCSYLPSATIRGLISGTSISLNLFGANGSQFAQLGTLANNPTVTVSSDGKIINGSYFFSAVSSSCPPDQGTFELAFQ